jgi:hypothetical protein
MSAVIAVIVTDKKAPSRNGRGPSRVELRGLEPLTLTLPV